MKKITSIVLALLLACAALAGCGGSSASSQAGGGTAAADGKTAISVSWWGGDSRFEATQKALDAYVETNPGVEISTSYGAWTGWEDSMSTAFYAGTAQDVDQVNWNWIYDYDNGGKTFVDLNTLSDAIDLTQFDESALEQCTVDGRLSAIPVAMTGRLFFWNETPYKEAGISVPATYDDLMAAGAIFQEKLGDDYYPMIMAEYDRMIFMVWALECKYGKNWVENGELQYTAEEIAEGLQMLLDMEAAHVIPTISKVVGDGAESIDKNPNWIDGKYGGIFEWDSAGTKNRDALADSSGFTVGNYLTGFGDYHGGFTKVSLGFSIAQSCQNQQEAAKLINYLLNEEDGIKAMGSERGIPLSKKGLEVCIDNDLLDPTVAEANGIVMEWCDFTLDPAFEDASLKATNTGVYWDVMAGVSYGDYTPAEGAQILIDGIESAIASKA